MAALCLAQMMQRLLMLYIKNIFYYCNPFLFLRKGFFLNVDCTAYISNFIDFRFVDLIETPMLQFHFLRGKKYSRYISFLFFFFIYWQAAAQVNKRTYRDSLFRKNADAAIHFYAPARPYYIVEWDEQAPKPIIIGSIKVVRQLDEKIAIIEIKNEA